MKETLKNRPSEEEVLDIFKTHVKETFTKQASNYLEYRKTYEKMDLPTLLEIIEHNLGTNIDSFYNKTKELNGRDIAYTDLTRNSNFLKGELKKQIGEYLKIVVKNIIYYLNHNFEWSKYLNEAVKE